MTGKKWPVPTLASLSLILCLFSQSLFPGIPEKKETYPRVQAAKTETDHVLREVFRAKELSYPPKKIFIRAFKKEKTLELWALSSVNTYTLVRSYPFCSTSGVLGPKRREGDLQIPEGFYHIDRFNPWSQFYLSLGINYPNRSDRIRGDQKNPGGDIFIHGSCVTIGCIPITDEKIKELYWIALLARRSGQRRIPVHIFPARMDQSNFRLLCDRAADPVFWSGFKERTGDTHPRTPSQLVDFWKNLKAAYDRFEETGDLGTIRIDRQGRYRLSDSG